jgi:hypothetical protein
MDQKNVDDTRDKHQTPPENKKQPVPNFDKPLGSSHNDEADLRDVTEEAAKKSQ